MGIALKVIAAHELVRRCEHDLGYKLSEGQTVDLILDQGLCERLEQAQHVAHVLFDVPPEPVVYPSGDYIVRHRDEDGTWFWEGHGCWTPRKSKALRTDHATAAAFAKSYNDDVPLEMLRGNAIVIDTRGAA